MAFDAKQEAAVGFSEAVQFMVYGLPESLRREAFQHLEQLVSQLGPLVVGYPTWHPLVSNIEAPEYSVSDPAVLFEGCDHTICFRDGFVTCPYDDGKHVLTSVDEHWHPDATIAAEVLPFQLYGVRTTAILVTHQWRAEVAPPARDGTLPLALAARLLLKQALPDLANRNAVAEPWARMEASLLGNPCGDCESFFVAKSAGRQLRYLWETVVDTGALGPRRVGEPRPYSPRPRGTDIPARPARHLDLDQPGVK